MIRQPFLTSAFHLVNDDAMMDLNDLYFFVHVVDHAGFAPAARALGVPKSRLSRRIAELEARLGVRLLHRSTRRFAVTDIGQEYYRHALAMVVEANAAQEAIDRSRSGPQGVIRVSAPPTLVCFQLGRIIAAYMAENPRVTIDLVSTSRPVDVIGEGIDVALRVRFPPLEESDLVMRRLGLSAQRLVAAPGLCVGHTLPLRPADLAGLPSLGLAAQARQQIWHLLGPNGAEARIPHSPRLATDDMAQLLYAALAGIGVVQLPTMVADAHLADGSLVEVLQGWAPASGIIHAVFPSRRGLLPSVRSFIDFLAAQYETLPAAAQDAAAGQRVA